MKCIFTETAIQVKNVNLKFRLTESVDMPLVIFLSEMRLYKDTMTYKIPF